MNKIYPTRNDIVVERVASPRVSSIYLPENVSGENIIAKVIRKGNECKREIETGMICLFNKRNSKLSEGNIYIFNESHAIVFLRGKIWWPFKGFSIVKRLVEEEILPSGVIIPSCYQTKDQTNECIYVAGDSSELKAGDKIHLGKWNDKFIELGMDLEYMLCIPTKDIVYKYDS